jgi:murein DD-endopeptidase MepM/ murein hydrolase activator NlpD
LPARSTYTTAPHASPAGLLRACPSGGSNLGPTDLAGVSLLYTPYISANDLTLIRNPTEAACLSSGFGDRALASGGGKSHTGLDLANAAGGYVYAAADGRVSYVGQRGDYGLVMELDHGARVHTIYAHLSETDPALPAGAFVAAGAPIGRMGMTGNATGVHLHYEVVVEGAKVDPLNYGQPASPEPRPVS